LIAIGHHQACAASKRFADAHGGVLTLYPGTGEPSGTRPVSASRWWRVCSRNFQPTAAVHLLLLVSAFARSPALLDLYARSDHAGYRFFSYGDAMDRPSRRRPGKTRCKQPAKAAPQADQNESPRRSGRIIREHIYARRCLKVRPATPGIALSVIQARRPGCGQRSPS